MYSLMFSFACCLRYAISKTALGGNITINYPLYGMKILAQNVQGIILPNTGHWIPEEQPVFVVKLLNNFFSGKPTATSK